jgi:hypothetical protein
MNNGDRCLEVLAEEHHRVGDQLVKLRSVPSSSMRCAATEGWRIPFS